ncbi:23S rRNA (guanosine(2251)-2'-O)-methyltransferase RlmB [Tessaracoccus sp. OH4464_COT-324]|uniref:23S rRNA (guanosine(2251)-2'-O)-methyltransferase RlmB n=1 Tax=Tessaracoccus sp. OH4464_COT-324 TaxID=2491059 RepID=UPI000F63B03C|nr:23S rRNA (guanosine(2251)-2'-O)-methyltransferase RlmB [Tessaracoccus sp. OH4464_COT-324]RRD46744.1 23S rRNA (guanosine(2251)-2'-O)-methyltransferase RlmB [Tessaracoccus sp. OH4464_COT-324]
MAGNSSRRGAGKRGISKAAGSGGRNRKGLAGRGPTPKAEDRVYHKAYKAKQEALRRQAAKPKRQIRHKPGTDWVVGRNPVFEALTAGMPVKQVYLAEGAERDDRIRDILKFAAEHSVPLLHVPRSELDRVTGGLVHQGVALQLPQYEYADPEELLADVVHSDAVIVACDGITDPRNLGAIIRSAAAFGAAGVVIPERRSASLTAAAWKTSAGAAARIPIAKAGNLNRALEQASRLGYTIVGLAGEGDTQLGAVPGVDGPLVLVVGSEDEGLARLVRKHCDALVSIPIASSVESLNASVAASIALYEASLQRPTE